MTDFKNDAKSTVTDEQSLREVFRATHDLAIQKVQTSIDKHAQAFIERPLFVCAGTQNLDGKAGRRLYPSTHQNLVGNYFAV